MARELGTSFVERAVARSGVSRALNNGPLRQYAINTAIRMADAIHPDVSKKSDLPISMLERVLLLWITDPDGSKIDEYINNPDNRGSRESINVLLRLAGSKAPPKKNKAEWRDAGLGYFGFSLASIDAARNARIADYANSKVTDKLHELGALFDRRLRQYAVSLGVYSPDFDPLFRWLGTAYKMPDGSVVKLYDWLIALGGNLNPVKYVNGDITTYTINDVIVRPSVYRYVEWLKTSGYAGS